MSALRSLNGALSDTHGYLCSYCMFSVVFNFVMMKKEKALELLPLCRRLPSHHSPQTASWLIMTERKVQAVTA